MSSLPNDTEDFPRGGSGALSPLEIRRVTQEAEKDILFGVSVKTREDSQIDFATGNVFLHVWERGWGFYTRTFLKFLAIIDIFQAEKLPEKPCQQGRVL